MSDTGTEKTAEKIKDDVRVDEFARQVLAVHGYKGRLPDGLVSVYNDFARTKNLMQPGFLSAEGFAFVVTLYRLFEKK